MTDRKMLIIVPTRSRPENVAKVVRAWEATGAFNDGAELLFAADRDDPKAYDYASAFTLHKNLGFPIKWHWEDRWIPMVHKLNRSALDYRHLFFAIGFAGDDHLPRTRDWAGRYVNALAEMGTGIVSCPDGHRQDELPTQWAMTSDIVRALGRMVPAPVEHLYCDDAIRDLGRAAGCYRWLDDVLIEHMHPLWKRGEWDEQYRRVNDSGQYARDNAAYEIWRGHDLGLASCGLGHDADKVRELMEAHRA